MSRIAYVNGRYVPHRAAQVHIEDRGYQFADGVYEVCEIFEGDVIDEAGHFARLDRSLSELRIPVPLQPAAFRVVLREIVARNKVRDGYVYIQVTRGVAKRDHAFPVNPVPAVVLTARSVDPARGKANAEKGVAIVTTRDIRWKRVDIKTVALLPNVLARQEARDKGSYEAWLVDDDGLVTEGASCNAWIINEAGTLVTRHADNLILRGITRTTLLEIVKTENIRVEERAFSLEEAFSAREAFITGATTLVTPVVSIDGRPIGSGTPGPVAQRLRGLFHSMAARS